MSEVEQIPLASVVIPAHNEEAVISRSLGVLLADTQPGELEVVVVCNGCQDATAETVRRDFPQVDVLEIGASSKPAALNAGDSAARVFPRIYLDADVELSTESARHTAARLGDTDAPLLAAPVVETDLRGASAIVCAFYRCFLGSRYMREGVIGGGVYGVNRAGRGRFGEFPNLMSDDLFVSDLFSGDERVVVEGSDSLHRPPRTLRALVDVRTRVYAGNIAARKVAAGSVDPPTGSSTPRITVRELIMSIRGPRDAIDFAAFAAVNVAAKTRARRHLHKAESVWHRDDTSRKAPSS